MTTTTPAEVRDRRVTQRVSFRSPQLTLAALCASAIALRLIVFTSRGDYIAFDEGWYLLLGRSVFEGHGFRLSGLQHTTLSPLFPLLAGAVGWVIDNAVWGGRIVAAVCSGLLAWPCWFIFRRLGGDIVAWSACALLVVTPSLAPFAAPYWIGWDLWVGAEPVLHLLLFAAIALTLRARERDRLLDWAYAGAAFALAYLARPEAVIPFAMMGGALGVLALLRRQPRPVAHALVMALSFVLIAAPYWIYLRDATGRWTLTGRYVELPSVKASTTDADATAGSGSRLTGIEAMLWRNDNRQYVRELYGLDATGRRLRSTYWGIPEPLSGSGTPVVNDSADVTALLGGQVLGAAAVGEPDTTGVSTSAEAAPAVSVAPPPQPSRAELYARTLGTVAPWFVWLLAVCGLPGRRTRPLDELLVVLPLVATSVLVARVIGADPRTQLFIVPLALFYAARGIRLIGGIVESRAGSGGMRQGFIGTVGTAVLAVALASTLVYWTWMGWSMGSPHHTIGAANRQVARELAVNVPAGEPVMSWHPAVALFADRDWRVLPYASLPQIIGYADAIDVRHVTLSRFYPGSKLFEPLDREHLVLEVPPHAAAEAGWWVDIQRDNGRNAFGVLRPRVEARP